MSELSKDTVRRIHNLVGSAVPPDQLTTIPLVQAAAVAGDVDLLKMIFEVGGPAAFVGMGAKGHRVDAFEVAAAVNQVEVMRWLLSSGAIDSVSHQLSSGVTGKELEIRCKAAALAAAAGSFEALSLIAEFLPAIKERQMWEVGSGEIVVERQINATPEKITINRAGLLGLLTCAMSVARATGRDTAPMIAEFQNFVQSGVMPIAEDIHLSVNLGEVEAFAAMLGAGVRMSPRTFGSRLGESTRAASMLEALNNHVATVGASFGDVFYDDDSVTKPGSYAEFSGKEGNSVYAKISEFLTAMGYLAVSSRLRAGGPYAASVECDEEKLATNMIQFFKLVMPDAVSPDMLARAAAADSLVLVRRLLEEGVDPNARPHWWENGTLAGRAPIHRCISADMIRLLHAHGADVALPLHHAMTAGGKEIEGNLFTLMCTERDDADMIQAFAECGGDLGQKFGGRTVMQLAAPRSERFKEAINSVKSGMAIAGSIETSALPSHRARSTGPTSL